jgi:hypothetical protein
MTEHLVVHPKQFERHRPFPDLDATNTKRAQPGRDGSDVGDGDVQSDRVYLGFGKNRDSAMPDAQPFRTPLPSDPEQHVVLDPEMARFLRDGACRR